MKYTLHLKRNSTHLPTVELDGERILTNDIHFAGDFNPHNVKLWVIGNEYGAMGAVWADCEQDALDELVDSGLGDGLLIEEKDATEDSDRLGNAGEPADLDYVWMAEVEFDPACDIKTMLKLAEAKGACEDNLDKV
jgi:hypothetical protein